MTPDRALAADVWSYWSLLKALQSPEQIAASAVASGYGAVLLADWCSLSGALSFVETAQAQGIRPLVGVTVPGPDGAPVRVVGRTQAAWPFLCQLVTTGRLDSFEAPPAGTVAYILAEGAARPPAPIAFPVYRLVSDPAAVPPADQVPLAALPFRYPEPALAPAWEALARVSREAHGGGTAWLAADALRDRFGATHPAVSGWGRLMDQVNEPAVPAYAERLPRFETGGQDPETVLQEQAASGLRRRFGQEPPAAYQQRLQYELQVIRDLRVASYFLIVADLVAEARRRRIRVGPGRGSAAASLVSWALQITDLDPIEWDLIFERFLNPARKSLPDIDLDIEDVGRAPLIQYLRERWGRERVAQIGTYGTFGARAAVRDAGRALGVAADVVDAAARLIPQRPDVTLESALADVAALAPALGVGGPDWLPVARAIEGAPRHASTHAAGVVVAPGPIGAWSPLQADSSVTTLPMGDLDRLGLLKLDLLGLRTLSVVREVRARIAGSVPELPDVPRDDPETLSLLGHGETEGIFQLDGRGVKELLADLKPASVADIMLTVALFRPGPMDHIRDYLRERRERTLAPLETGSVLVFQEQLMALVRETAGYSWAEADLFRRAVSKKDRALLASERDRFLGRAAAAVGMREAQELWHRIEAFADYGFNKAHAACYGFLAYYMAYLKTHHPYAFWAGEWATRGHGESLGRAIAAAFREGVAPLPPHVNRSQPGPSAEDPGGGVRLGLAAVRGVGSELAQRVVTEREANGLYTSVTDLARRVAAIERALPTLWHADALRDLEGAERVPDPGRTRSGQLSLFDDEPVAAAESAVDPDPLEAFGWDWPQSDGAVYLRVTRFADVDQDAVRQAASRFPGPETVVAAESGSRSGRRLPVAVSGTVWALRALRGVPGVKSAMRGLSMPAKGGRDES